jgi:hypothetical protein
VTPERAAALVRRWVLLYTRSLAEPVAQRRLEEIDADLQDHVAYRRAAGLPDREIAREVASRTIRGVPADLAWRRRQPKARRTRSALGRSVARVAAGVAVVLALPLAATLATESVAWSPADFVLAGALLAIVGATIELAVRRAGNAAIALGVAVLGVAAAVLGELDDAPGLVLLGILLLAGACGIAIRRLQHGR